MIVRIGWEFNVTTYRIYDMRGNDITILSNSKLYRDILQWFEENIGDLDYDSPTISFVRFSNEGDYNLFRLAFDSRCKTILDSDV